MNINKLNELISDLEHKLLNLGEDLKSILNVKLSYLEKHQDDMAIFVKNYYEHLLNIYEIKYAGKQASANI